MMRVPIALLLCASVARGQWQAGVAKVAITPTSPMWMSGYAARTHPAEGTLHDLWAKALVLDDGQQGRIVLVTLDLVGIDRALATAICQQLADKHGLRREQIALNCSHTHCGPVAGGTLTSMYFLDDAQQKYVADYTADLQRKIVDVVGAALAAKRPASVSFATGHADYAVNRRNNKEADVPRLREAGQLRGPVDHDVPVLAVRSTQNDALLAVAFGYACHATTLGFYQWCGDHPGFAMIELEKNHPGAVAMFWAGCGADQNPIPRRTVELAQEYGHRLAVAVDAGLSAGAKPIAGTIATRYREIDLAFDKVPSRDEIVADLASPNKYVVNRAKMLLAQLESGQSIESSYPYPVQVWRLGPDLKWVLLGGEVVVDYALRLKSQFGPATTWVAGYTNDVMGYIPSERVLKEGGYEGGGAMVYYGHPSPWAAGLEQQIVDAATVAAQRAE
ncbi:MAG TPA: neutral/alkaline non-lysosomal ceramidase N-terminal domain-containing protein [Pirellulales bacterium]|nr:neutral/alkaline non-lysosomal ceramidase N-terminal domain-containing protein [Pirellulales bacterium]